MKVDYLRKAKINLVDFCSMQTECDLCPFCISDEYDCELWLAIFMINDLIRLYSDVIYLEVH